ADASWWHTTGRDRMVIGRRSKCRIFPVSFSLVMPSRLKGCSPMRPSLRGEPPDLPRQRWRTHRFWSTMVEVDAAEFAALRTRLEAIAYRMAGSVADAEDVVQDAWIRWSATERGTIAEPEAYLVRIVTRLAIDRLRSA